MASFRSCVITTVSFNPPINLAPTKKNKAVEIQEKEEERENKYIGICYFSIGCKMKKV